MRNGAVFFCTPVDLCATSGVSGASATFRRGSCPPAASVALLVTSIALAWLGHSLGFGVLAGSWGLPDIDLFGEVAFVVAMDVVFVAEVGFDQLTF
jgi:hypothetical protein